MEDKCHTFSKKLYKIGNILDRSSFTQGVSSASNVCSLEARSLQYGQKCILRNLQQRSVLWIPSILPHSTTFKVYKERIEVDSNNSLLVKAVVVSSDFKQFNSETHHYFNWSSSDKFSRLSLSTCEKQSTYLSGVDFLQRGLIEEGVLVEATNLISNSRK